MYQGNWKCSHCSGTITELPFQPRSEAGLTCRSCYAKNKKGSTPKHENAVPMKSAEEMADIPFEAGLASEAPPIDDDFGLRATPVANERPRFEGAWECASCGTSITSLPFAPRSTNNLKCIDCFKQSKG